QSDSRTGNDVRLVFYFLLCLTAVGLSPCPPSLSMPVPLLDLRAQHAVIRDEVLPALMDVVDSQLFILGAPVERLEQAVAELSHTRYAVGCASGTDALLLALR